MATNPATSHQSATVLIAGCGYVGLRAAQRLLSAGVTVSALTRDANKADQLRSAGIQPIVADLGDLSAPLPQLPDVDAVLWSVGYQRVAGQERKAIWIDGLRRLVESLPARTNKAKSPRRIIYTSSTGVYGDGGGADVDEFTPATPVTEGGRACLEAESLLRQLAEHGQLQAIILRLAGIYGPDRLLRRVTELKSGVPITTPPDDWLNLIHVDDAVAMIQHTLQSSEIESHLTKGSIVINVVASETVTRREYYEQLAKLVNAPVPVFQSSTSLPAQPESPRSRGRSGNRRVVSTTRPRLAVDFLFDNLISGLADAVTRSSANHD